MHTSVREAEKVQQGGGGSGRQLGVLLKLPLRRSSRPASLADARLFTLDQRSQLKGRHARLQSPVPGMTYVAGVALSHPPKPSAASALRGGHITTITLGETAGDGGTRVVQHYRWQTPTDMAELRATLAETWGCRVAVIGGVGATGRTLSIRMKPGGPSSIAGESHPPHVASIDTLLEAVSAGQISVYADDSSAESQGFWSQVIRARRQGIGPAARAYVEPSTGDDGFVASLLLMAEAGQCLAPSPRPSRVSMAAAA